jgi:hypothetical protein
MKVRRSLTLLVAVLAMAGAGLGVGLAHADGNQTCTPPQWVTYWTVPIGSRSTCFNPNGSYQVCTSMGTQGNGPGTCINYPAPPAPAPANLLPINPPVPGPPPPPPFDKEIGEMTPLLAPVRWVDLDPDWPNTKWTGDDSGPCKQEFQDGRYEIRAVRPRGENRFAAVWCPYWHGDVQWVHPSTIELLAWDLEHGDCTIAVYAHRRANGRGVKGRCLR